MPRKKQAESAKSRRQKLLDYFHSRPRKPSFIADVKNDLNIKNEQNLRRDLELLAEEGVLDKSKDTSKLPARTVYTLKDGAPKAIKGQPEAQEAAEAPAKVAPAKPKAASSNGTAAAAVEDQKGRRSARELEQQILSLLEEQPTTVKDLADHLKRQQPTVTKALERMQERRLVERKRQGRSFVYSRLSKAVSAPSSAAPAGGTAAPPAQAVSEAPAKASQAAVSQAADSGAQNFSVQSIIDAAVRAGINAALDHILAAKR